MISSLNDYVLNAIRNRTVKQTYDAISEATGIPARWLYEYAAGRKVAPPVQHVEALYVYFTGAPLVLVHQLKSVPA